MDALGFEVLAPEGDIVHKTAPKTVAVFPLRMAYEDIN